MVSMVTLQSSCLLALCGVVSTTPTHAHPTACSTHDRGLAKIV